VNIANLSTLKIHKLSNEQYQREKAAGTLDDTALYLTPDEDNDIDLSGYATTEQLNDAVQQAKKYIDRQRLAYTEIQEDEILAPTICSRVQDEDYVDENGHCFPVGSYIIPNSYGLDGDYEYYLYVNGQEFKYSYDPNGSGWGRIDHADMRFNSLYESIVPDQIDPIPEAVTVSIKQVSTSIRTMDEQYLPDGYAGLPTRVSRLETGGVLLPKSEYDFDVGASDSSATFVLPDVYDVVLPGSKLKVYFDGIDYVCEVRTVDESGVTYRCFGNMALADLSDAYGDTGEPFCAVIVKDAASQAIMLACFNTTETHIVGISLATSNDEPIDPNRLPDGGVGYTESEVVLPPTEFEFEYFSDAGVYAAQGLRPAFKLVDGRSYKVVWNGVEYNCVAISFSVADMRTVTVGNAGPLNMGVPDTGEPFLLCYTENSYDDEFNDVFSFDSTATASVIEETIHTIDPKYLPDGGIGYTETTTVLPSTELHFDYASNVGAYLYGPFTHTFEPKEGQRFKVVWDGVEYICVAKRVTVFGTDVVAIGNLVAAGMSDTGEPFCAVYGDTQIIGMGWAVYAFTGAPLTASIVAETIHSIDSKYFPEGCVGYDDSKIVYQTADLSLENSGDYFVCNQSPAPFLLVEGKRYKVIWNSVEYDCVAYQNPIGPEILIGNFDFIDPVGSYSGEPFCIGAYENWDSTTYMNITSFDSQAAFSIIEGTVHTIDQKYLPEEVKTKAIDLDEYGIGQIILRLTSQGGGSMELEDTDVFWDALGENANVDMRMYLNYSGTILECGGVSKAHNGNGRWLQLSSSILTTVNDNSIPIQIDICITRNGSSSYVHVQTSEPEDDSSTTVMGINMIPLHGNTQMVYLTPQTEYHCVDALVYLEVNGFETSDNGFADTWGIHFVAGETITVTLPDSVVWNYGATPVFTPGSEYWLLFTPMLNGKVLGVWNEVEA